MSFGRTTLVIAFTLASGCGAHPRPAPNDEVSTPINAADESSLNQGHEPDAPDAGPAQD